MRLFYKNVSSQFAIALLCSIALFTLNTLPDLLLKLGVNDNVIPFGMPVTGDNLQYITWIKAHQKGLLIPNYHLTESTESRFLVPLALIIAKISHTFDFDIVTTYQATRFVVYLWSGLVALYFLRTFQKTVPWMLLSLILACACVPLRSVLIPIVFLRAGGFPFGVPGSGEYMYVANTLLQDWNHSLPGAVGALCSTLGIAAAVRWLTEKKYRDFWLFCLACGLSALLHPFEYVYLIMYFAVGLLVSDRDRGSFKLLLLPIAISGACLSVYVIPAATTDWIRVVASINRGALLLPPVALLEALGMPVLVGLGGVAIVRFGRRPIDMRTWLGALSLGLYLTLPYVGGLPFPRHFLSGISIVAGVVCARVIQEVWAWATGGMRILVGTVVALGVVCGLTGYGALHVVRCVAAMDGTERFSSVSGFPRSFLQAEEAEVYEWFKRRARPADTVAAGRLAPLLASVPMRSFGSHAIFSIKPRNRGDWALRDRIVSGEANLHEVADFIRRRRIRFVVTEVDGVGLDPCIQEARYGRYAIWDCGALLNGGR